MKIGIVLGTRPEIIKLSSIIRHCISNNINYFVIHTGQHYSYHMDEIFFSELNLPKCKYYLNVGSGNHGKQTGMMMDKIEEILMKERPDVVLVQGDTNTVLAGALAASKLQIKVGHVEAGLRSYDRTMPEELNRITADHLSDYLFCPTEKSAGTALGEGIDKNNVFITGNTIVDAVYQNIEISKSKDDIITKLGLKKEGYILVTAHRPGNVDSKENLEHMIHGVNLIYGKFGLPLIWPIHPRTKKMLEKYNLAAPRGTMIVDPVGFLEFTQLELNAKLIITDSGGVQEEACIMKVPCVTLRENTERTETVDVGANILVGTDPEKMLKGVETMLNKETSWANPFGDGSSGKLIMELLRKSLT